MSERRRHRIVVLVLFTLLLAGMAARSVAAQEEEEPESPASEPDMIDIPETDNPRLAAASALRDGQNLLRSARSQAEKAGRADEKKRAKLEARAHSDYESAAQQFLAAIRYDKDLVGAYVGLGEAWMQLGENDKALQAWTAAQHRAPNDKEARFGLGRCLVALDRPRDAAGVYLSLAKDDPDDAKALLELLRAWGEPKARDGDEQAKQLMDWIAQQGQGPGQGSGQNPG